VICQRSLPSGKYALVAQRIEHWFPKPGVAGSSPAGRGCNSFENKDLSLFGKDAKKVGRQLVAIMRNVGKPFKLKNKPGWWLRWTCPVVGKRIAKAFHTKALADHYRSILYTQLNSDVFVGTVNVPIDTAIDEYLLTYDTRGLTEAAKEQAEYSLKHLTEITGAKHGTKSLAQKHLDLLIAKRKGEVGTWTVNKDIANVKAFLRWGQHRQRRYFSEDLAIVKLKAPPIIVTALTNKQIKELIARCGDARWRMLILISLVTGLRKSDVDSLTLANVDLDRLIVAGRHKKTGKPYSAPIPDKLAPLLTAYIASLASGQMRLFNIQNSRKGWDSFKQGVTRQDLRKTFSTIMQTVGSISSAQDLLGHASARTTGQFYTDHDLILRWKVNQLPVEKWLDITAKDS